MNREYFTIYLPLGSKPKYNLQRKKGLEEIPGIVSGSAASYKDRYGNLLLILILNICFQKSFIFIIC